MDGIVIVLIGAGVAIVGAIVGGGNGASTGFHVGYLLASFFYAPIMLCGWDGQTLGKRFADVRVIRMDHTPVGFWRAILRETVVKFLQGATSIGFILGALWPLWNRLHRAWWDYASGTRVIEV